MIEQTIISNLLYNENYNKIVLPYLKEEYFDEPDAKTIFKTVHEYFGKYREIPSKEALKVSLDNRRDLNEQSFKEVLKTVDSLAIDQDTNFEWLVSSTEKFCQDKDLYLSIRRAITVLDGKDKELDKGAIPKILADSLAINFDSRIGHNYMEDHESRFEYYNREETRLPFDIEMLNRITQGGLPPKSLTAFLGGTGSGKSLVMTHCAAANYMHGKNVLYVTLELSEEEIGRRVDANLLDVPVSEIKNMEKEEFERKIARIKKKTPGSLIIKEYPTGSMNANHLRHVLNEIKTKQGITIDIIYLDYINLCSSFRIKNTNANSFTIVKSIAEEMRGLATEYGIPIVTATQTTRSGLTNSDMDMGDTSESIGLVYTLDAFFALITDENLEKMGKLVIKQLKNRWGDLNLYKRFAIGIDRSKMRLYNLEDSAQADIYQTTNEQPVFDKSKFASKDDSKKKMFQLEDIE